MAFLLLHNYTDFIRTSREALFPARLPRCAPACKALRRRSRWSRRKPQRLQGL